MNTPDASPLYDITPGAGGLPRLDLASPDGARASAYLHGANIVSWIPAGGGERLFLSRASRFSPGEPIQGGVPVVFPQFRLLGPLPIHGLARLVSWQFTGAMSSGGRASAIFHLRDTEESRRLWPHAFLAELTVSIGGNRMEAALGVTNTGIEVFKFTAALHTYLAVPKVTDVTINGLVGLRYRDTADNGIEKPEASPRVGFTGEVDRVYLNAPADVRLVEPGRETTIRKAGFTDTVVWNPGAEKCAAAPDLEQEDYLRYVCVESACIGSPVCLAPGESWQGSQTLIV